MSEIGACNLDNFHPHSKEIKYRIEILKIYMIKGVQKNQTVDIFLNNFQIFVLKFDGEVVHLIRNHSI